jgi:hypothetical protein
MADLLESKKVRTRKEHTCQGCGKHIKKGELANMAVVADSGAIWRYYECEKCFDYAQKECSHCKDFDFCLGLNYEMGSLKMCMDERSLEVR